MHLLRTHGKQSLDSCAERLDLGAVALLGVPFDANSSYRGGPALAPPAIRAALHSGAFSLFSESGLDLGSESRFHDLGDLVLCNRIEDFHAIESAAAEIACRGSRLLAMGGDHSITYPLLRALAAKHPGLGLLQVDAHPDIRDEQDGNRYSHASPFARILEEGLISRLVQVGIRFLSPPNLRQIERFGSEVIPMVDWPPPNLPAFDGPFYLSLDLDGLDPAFAPGVTHREPGGLATREVLQLIHRTPGQLVGADIVEYNPERDVDGITAVVAAKLVKEVAARLLHHHH